MVKIARIRRSALIVLLSAGVLRPCIGNARGSDPPDSAVGYALEFETPEAFLRLAAFGQLDVTAEITAESGLRKHWVGYNPADILDPQADTTADKALQSVYSRSRDAGMNVTALEDTVSAWVEWYGLLAGLGKTVHPSYVAAAITITSVTRSACSTRSDEDVQRLGPQIGSRFEPSEIRRIFYQATTLLVRLDPPERYRVLAEITRSLAVVCENGWMVR